VILAANDKECEDFQELIDWNLIDSKSRLYFRTVEDTNKMDSLTRMMWCSTITLICQNEWKVPLRANLK
jgi:hypothetical protein